MNIFLTGATGFVGRHAAATLISEGHTVYALVRNLFQAHFLTLQGVHLVFGSLESLDAVSFNFAIDAVIHVGGLIKTLNPEDFYRVNSRGTENLIHFVEKKLKPKIFVFVSSISARGPNAGSHDFSGMGPLSHYGKSKKEAETMLLSKDRAFPVVIVRPPIVYGPGDRETLRLFKLFKSGFFPTFSRTLKVSFIHVEDLARFLAHLCLDPPSHGTIFHPEDGHGGYALDELLDLGGNLYGRKIKPVFFPLWFVAFFCRIAEIFGKLVHRTPFFTRDKFSEMKQNYWFCVSESDCKIFFNQTPIGLDFGLNQTKNWYENKGWLKI